MGHHHHHSHYDHHESTNNLSIAFWLNTIFAIIEVFGGLYTNSVAILSDALHDFGDSLSLGTAYYFQKKSQKMRDQTYSYGYKRFSLLGAFINSIILVVGSVFVIQEAIKRLAVPEQADAKGMIVFAVLGITVNTIAMLRLRKGNSVNERVVSLHFIEDIMGWAAVLIGSIVMLFFDVPMLDPILSICISGYILINIFKNLRYAFRIILQAIPENIDVEAIRKQILNIKNVKNLHDVHTWSMDGLYNVMTIHVVLHEETTLRAANEIKDKIRHSLHHLNIQHLTIETETEDHQCDLKDC